MAWIKYTKKPEAPIVVKLRAIKHFGNLDGEHVFALYVKSKSDLNRFLRLKGKKILLQED